eukprot:Em0019g711a
MAMSGIEVDPSVVSLFNDMKIRHSHKFAVFRIEKKKTIVLDFAADADETTDREGDKKRFQEASALLKTAEPRYVLYDFRFTTKEGRLMNKLAFIFWCPEDSKVGDKMLYAASKDAIKKSFTGLSSEFQANDRGDFDYTTYADEVEKKN